MEIKVSTTELEGVFTLELGVFRDNRGFFFESYNRKQFASVGFDIAFVQDNHSRSHKNVIRGLHFQNRNAPQYRLVRCTVGEVWDVIVDLRVGSPTLGKWMGITLSAENMRQLLVPPEFAHGFAVMSDIAEVQYKCSGHHLPLAERALAWDDPRVGIPWPIREPILSERDRSSGMSFDDYLNDETFEYANAATPAR